MYNQFQKKGCKVRTQKTYEDVGVGWLVVWGVFCLSVTLHVVAQPGGGGGDGGDGGDDGGG